MKTDIRDGSADVLGENYFSRSRDGGRGCMGAVVGAAAAAGGDASMVVELIVCAGLS